MEKRETYPEEINGNRRCGISIGKLTQLEPTQKKGKKDFWHFIHHILFKR